MIRDIIGEWETSTEKLTIFWDMYDIIDEGNPSRPKEINQLVFKIIIKENKENIKRNIFDLKRNQILKQFLVFKMYRSERVIMSVEIF